MQTRLGRRTGEYGTLLIYSFPRERQADDRKRIKRRTTQNYKLKLKINAVGPRAARAEDSGQKECRETVPD